MKNIFLLITVVTLAGCGKTQLSQAMERSEQQLELLKRNGDLGGFSRMVDHFAIFTDQGSADRFIEGAERMGFSGKVIGSDTQRGVEVWFCRESKADRETVMEVTRQLVELVSNYGGEYTGWSCPVVL